MGDQLTYASATGSSGPMSLFGVVKIKKGQISAIPNSVPVFCRIMRVKSNLQNRNYMLDYVINLLDDAHDFLWPSSEASHAILACRMEQEEVSGW